MGIIRSKLLLINLLTFIYLPLAGQIDTVSNKSGTKTDPGESFYIFSSNELLEVTLRLDLAAYLRRNLEGISKDAILVFKSGEEEIFQRKVRIDTRGFFRLQTCSFAPMEVKFKDDIYAYPGSDKVKKIKVVNHCRTGALYDDYVLREFLVYKLFNVATDTSYRVRLLRITYEDLNDKRKPFTQYGFFIEPKSILAERIGADVEDSKKMTNQHIVPDVMDRIGIFNYMVSNWDYQVYSQHNFHIFKSGDPEITGLRLGVPYDFDLTGVVNANYAVTHPEYNPESIRQRIFLGACRSEEIYRKELLEFLAMKDRFYSEINEFPYLSQRSKKDIIAFLDQFFEQLEKSNSIDRLISSFASTCKLY